jgi:hypothetical protein
MMKFMRRSSQIGKKALSYQIRANIHSITFNSNPNVPNSSFTVTLIRGQKIANVPPANCQRGQVVWAHLVSLPCTLYADKTSPTGFQSKQCRFEVHMHNHQSRTRTLVGVAEIDLSNFIRSRGADAPMMRLPLIGSVQSRSVFSGSSVALTLAIGVEPATGFDPNLDREVQCGVQ